MQVRIKNAYFRYLAPLVFYLYEVPRAICLRLEGAPEPKVPASTMAREPREEMLHQKSLMPRIIARSNGALSRGRHR